jgi:hypothetical protein
MNKVVVDAENATARVTIDGVERELEICFRDWHPFLKETVWVGVRVGVQGRKLWRTPVSICRNTLYNPNNLSGSPQYVLVAVSPINSINRNLCHVAIVAFWDLVPDEAKSRR